MDGTALTALAHIHEALRAGGGELSLVGCRPAVVRILRLSGMDRLFSVGERPARREQAAAA